MFGRIVHQSIDIWQRKVILGTRSIQIPVIYTHSHLAIFLQHWYYVGHPLGILGHFEESCVQLFLHFFFDLQQHLRLDPSQFLFDQHALFSQRQPMYHDVSVEAWHVLV